MALKNVPLDALTFSDNVRTPGCLQIPAMVESFRRHGFKDNHPLVVSEKTDGTYLVLVGNRRGLALNWLRQNDAAAFAIVLPTAKVPCIVHKGLTPEQEADIRVDHGPDEDRVPLDDWSVFLAVKQLVKLGFGQEKIALKLGLKVGTKGQPNRSWVQPRCNLARLPRFVQDEYEKLLTIGKDATAVRIPDIAPLYKAYHVEYVEHPDGDGPEFQAAWLSAMTPHDRVKAEGNGQPLSVSKAKEKAQVCTSQIVRDTLLAATGLSKRTLDEIDGHACECEYAYAQLAKIKAHLGEEAWTELHKALVESDRLVDEERKAQEAIVNA